MNVKRLSAIIVFLLVAILGLVFIYNDEDTIGAQIISNPPPTVDPAFTRADKVIDFAFPEDHGPHPEYQTEWWYYTGNLESEAGAKFGYQLTFFRRALLPQDKVPARESDWATSQVYMAHFALSDIETGTHHAFERFSRGAVELAGAQSAPFQVWLENWEVSEISTSGEACPPSVQPPCVYQLTAQQDNIQLDLLLEDAKGPILQGDEGYSRKGPEPGQASYYYSLPRLESSGSLQIGDRLYRVEGLSWMDHEYSTSALSTDQTGWDWFSFQFEDGTELMLFQIRRSDGGIDPFSSGTWISADGDALDLKRDDFTVDVESTWRSPRSGAVYPAKWKITIPSLDLSLSAQPFIDDQELNLSYAYWEGAVQVSGSHEDRPIRGSGYVELTGYSQSMGGEF